MLVAHLRRTGEVDVGEVERLGDSGQGLGQQLPQDRRPQRVLLYPFLLGASRALCSRSRILS